MTTLGNPARQRLLTTPRVSAHTVALMAAQRAQRIGARMRERRAELEISQPEVAARMGVTSVTKDYVSRWERGVTEPSEAYLELIASALETTVADLMGGAHADREEQPTPDLGEALGDQSAEPKALNGDLAEVLNRLDAIQSVLKAQNADAAAMRKQLDELESQPKRRASAQK